jgi:hypothetical protein
MQKKLDLFANAAIALVALLIGFTLIRQQIDRSYAAKALAASNALQNQVRPGTPLAPIAGYPWAKHDRTLVLALRYGCSHCEHNMAFYKQLEDQIQQRDAKTSLLSVFPDDSFVARHDLDSHSLGAMPFVANINFAALHVPGTPTLLLVNNQGTILQSWIGELSPREQDDVMKAVQQ